MAWWVAENIACETACWFVLRCAFNSILRIISHNRCMYIQRCLALRFSLCLAVVSTVALAACIPDEKDPGASISETGKLTGAYYAAGLGNIAVQIQNHVVGNAAWFTALTGNMELDLASMGIAKDAMGAPVKSLICPSGTGSEVLQLTWIDAKNDQGNFSVKGVGQDGSIIGALRGRAGAEQVGLYEGGSAIAMSNGNLLAIPASCSSIGIPHGSPVIAVRIETPAAPSAEIARTEYRSAPCGMDSSGRERRGTLVQSRVVRYLPSGTIVPDSPNVGWGTESMGTCVDDVIVEIANRSQLEGGAAAELNSFANIALKSILDSALEMDCVSVDVESDLVTKDGPRPTGVREKKSKPINTCASASASGTEAVTDDRSLADSSDLKILTCTGNEVSAKVRFDLLPKPDKTGTSTIAWTGGTASLLRDLDRTQVSNGTGSQAERSVWVGRRIGCVGTEKHKFQCEKIPGAPEIKPRESTSGKWISQGISRSTVDETWADHIFFNCFIDCTRIKGGSMTYLNKKWFTGTYKADDRGTTTIRGMRAVSWIDPYTFKPRPEATGAWRIDQNQCVWATRVMHVECPRNYDARQQGTWTPSVLTVNSAFPAALKPGTGGSGIASNIYNGLMSSGEYVANVSVNMERKKLTWKGIKTTRWTDTAGPGTNAYIKSWSFSDRSSINPSKTVTVQNTLFNQDSVLLGYRPRLENQQPVVQRDGFAEPLRCGRGETRTFSWPATERRQVCTRSTGFLNWLQPTQCSMQTVSTTTTITETVVREWSGLGYESGTWSTPLVQYSSSSGAWSSLNQIPNPIDLGSSPVCNLKGCTY